MKNKWIAGLGAVMIFAGCSTDVELNAKWRDTTIVFGLLDYKESLHIIRINKAFLGEGNAYDMALVQDSSEYQNVTAVIEEMSGNTVLRSWTLNDTMLSDRSTDGIFYAPNYKAYYFVESTLNSAYTYNLRVNIAEASNKEVTASTPLVQSFSVTPPLTFGFASSNVGNNNTYYSPAIKWGLSPNAVRYEIILRLKYDEYTASGVTRKIIDWNQGTFDPASLSGGTQFVHQVPGQSFYQYMANKIADDPNVIKRVFRSIDMVAYAASQELDTYIQVNSPSNGLVQDKPEYTNIANGLGLFSSRLHIVSANKYISEFSMQELCEGEYTKINKDLKFCSDSAVYASKSYYCP